MQLVRNLGRDKIAELLIKNGASVEYKRANVTPMAGGVFWGNSYMNTTQTNQ